MKILDNIPNTPVPDADYPNSKVQDETNPGVGNGTPVNEAVYGDMVQFFQKLLIDAPIVANDLPDNVSNGYQTILALVAKIEASVKPQPIWVNDNTPAAHDANFRLTKVNSVQLKLQFSTSFVAGATIFTLPVGYRPVTEMFFALSHDKSIVIQTNGIVKGGANGATGEGASYSFFEFPLD